MIHPTAIIDKGAEIGSDIQIGPYTFIGAGVSLADGCKVGAHTVIEGKTSIGSNTHIGSFVSLGTVPQHKIYQDEPTRLEIGANNDIREYCNISRGTHDAGGLTDIGENNLLMAYSHIGHDSRLGSHIILTNATTLAGHVNVEDYAIIGSHVKVHQFCSIGAHALICSPTFCRKDVPPYIIVGYSKVNIRVITYGLNIRGLLRHHDFTNEDIRSLKRAYKIFFHSGLLISEAISQLEPLVANNRHVQHLIAFVQNSKRGVIR